MLTNRYPMIKGLILDMDGVLWHDKQPIGNLPRLFNQIRKLGLSFVLATNNSGKTIPEYQEKLAQMGVAVGQNQIVTSAAATFAYLREHYPDKNSLYIVGSSSLKRDGKQRGFEVLEDDDNSSATDFVLVGLDTKLTYQKIDIAARKIRSGSAFIATNSDATYPRPDGLTPGAGTMVAAIRTASGREPLVIGKPETHLYLLATKSLGLETSQILCVGDRLDTDILGAQRGGFPSALVLSGVSSEQDLANWEPKPTLVAKDLTALLND